MTRNIVCLLSLFTFMAFLPAFAKDAPANSKTECSTKCCASDTCNACAKMCEKTLEYCKKKGGKHASEKHINILKDCIAMCKMCADFSSRNSPLAAKLHALCAEACKSCAQSCKDLNDEKLKDCVDMCNTCAASCEKKSKK